MNLPLIRCFFQQALLWCTRSSSHPLLITYVIRTVYAAESLIQKSLRCSKLYLIFLTLTICSCRPAPALQSCNLTKCPYCQKLFFMQTTFCCLTSRAFTVCWAVWVMRLLKPRCMFPSPSFPLLIKLYDMTKKWCNCSFSAEPHSWRFPVISPISRQIP